MQTSWLRRLAQALAGVSAVCSTHLAVQASLLPGENAVHQRCWRLLYSLALRVLDAVAGAMPIVLCSGDHDAVQASVRCPGAQQLHRCLSCLHSITSAWAARSTSKLSCMCGCTDFRCWACTY